MPIGNLTSQIFANIYLNELDRFVRHQLKPLAYIRYGDDFMLFCVNKTQALRFQEETTNWLGHQLVLEFNPKSNIVFPTKKSAHFLGHFIYRNRTIHIDSHMSRKITTQINTKNASSYHSLHQTARQKKLLMWNILEQLEL